MRGLPCNRQQSILPGRFQPSTFDAWELNCCVRDGNRWSLSAIVTGSSEWSFQVSASSACGSLGRYTTVSSPVAHLVFLASSLKILIHPSGLFRPSKLYRRNYSQTSLSSLTFLNQALDGLVPVRSIHYCTYTPGLSTLSSSRRLTGLRHERSHLGVGFTLRCFQRLSCPDVATQRYAWRHNWYTIDPSTPVLSY